MDASEVARVIQLSVAPVFLLASVGGMLGVLTNRLTRIIDRARALERELANADAMRETEIQNEIGTLRRRARLINRAIVLTTATGFMICLVVAALFLADMLGAHLTAIIIAIIFIMAMLTFAGAFLYFLREIFVATAGLRIGARR